MQNTALIGLACCALAAIVPTFLPAASTPQQTQMAGAVLADVRGSSDTAVARDPSAAFKQPSVQLSARDVVQIQLKALQNNARPFPDAGIEQVWQFAHPDNKRSTGPLTRFARMMKGQAYAILLQHNASTISLVNETARMALFDVEVTGQAGQVVRYQWMLQRAFGGDLDGAWMTVSVSVPQTDGRRT